MLNIDFDKKTLEELIEIIESPQNYVEEMPHRALRELRRREITKEVKEEIAASQYQERCKDLLEGSLFQVNQMALPSSSVLSEEQKQEIFRIELSKFIDKRNSLNSGLPTG